MNKSFRISSRKLFLTYPQVPIEWDLELVKSSLFGVVLSIDYWLIAKELHQDGNPHFHCVLSLKKKFDSKNPNCLDILGHHGNYQGVKDYADCIKYCMKDKNFITNIPPDELDQIKDGLSDKQMANKRILKKALEFGPEKLLEDGDYAIHQFDFVVRGLNAYKKLKVEDLREELPTRLENDWNVDLRVNTDLKQCHFWIWSKEPNRGKTTFLMRLHRTYRAEFWNYGEVFQDKVTRKTELLLLDELRGSRLKVTTLNQICDGTFGFPQKGAPCIYPECGKLLVIVCSNLSIREAYKEDFWSYIEARFKEINID